MLIFQGVQPLQRNARWQRSTWWWIWRSLERSKRVKRRDMTGDSCEEAFSLFCNFAKCWNSTWPESMQMQVFGLFKKVKYQVQISNHPWINLARRNNIHYPELVAIRRHEGKSCCCCRSWWWWWWCYSRCCFKSFWNWRATIDWEWCIATTDITFCIPLVVSVWNVYLRNSGPKQPMSFFQTSSIYIVILSLKLTWHLKMDGWNTSFLLGWPILRGYVSFREGIHLENLKAAYFLDARSTIQLSCPLHRRALLWQ